MNRETIHILLVEGSETHAARIREVLESGLNQIKLTVVQNLAEARTRLSESFPSLAIINFLLPDGKGIELLPGDQEAAAYPAVIMTNRGDEQTAVEAMKAGALDYVVKSVAALADLPHIVERALREWTRIAERRRAEEALRESEERFRSFFEAAAAGMVTISPEGRFLEANEAFCGFIGYSRDELLNLRVPEITHPDDLERTAKNYWLLGNGRSRVIHYRKRLLRRDGSIVWGHVSVASVPSGDGLPRYYIGLVQDITESKRVQDQIRESKQMLQLVLDYIPQHVFWKDRNSVYLGCNRNFARAAGMETPRNLVGKTDYDLAWKREEADFYRECDRRVMEADTPELHTIEPQLQASGKQAWLDCNKIPLHDGEGRVVGILGTFEDITERKRAEKALVEANRELDAFVYTVSHDLRTPLTPIIGYAEVLQETCRDRLDEQSLDCLAEIKSHGRKMLALMEDLLVLAKVGHVQRPTEPVDLNAVVEEALADMGSLIAEAEVVTEKNPLPGLRMPETLLTQIFNNLIGNAVRYAGKEGSPIEIGGERRGDLVRLYVRDHGPGIPQEERSRIFEVFYRGATDKKSPGTGVGLATVQKISRLYGGRAWVEETPGGGSTFWVELMDPELRGLSVPNLLVV
ncbi:MAG: PAS domain S-box protein [Desulfuromonadales bacterium]|nr:PAS domain S-box protein [Desulfuromonadales bacterium]